MFKMVFSYHQLWLVLLILGNSIHSKSSFHQSCQDTTYLLIHSKLEICLSRPNSCSSHNLAIVLLKQILHHGKNMIDNIHSQYLSQKEYIQRDHLHLLDRDNRKNYHTAYHLKKFLTKKFSNIKKEPL